MLELLLDEHISPAVAVGVRKLHPQLTVYALRERHSGIYLGQSDDAILSLAVSEGLTLVTFDQKTIKPMAMDWAKDQKTHAGIVFIDEKTIALGNIGGMVRALAEVADIHLRDNWTDRIIFLKR